MELESVVFTCAFVVGLVAGWDLGGYKLTQRIWHGVPDWFFRSAKRLAGRRE